MQNFTPFEDNQYVSDAPSQLNENMNSIMSNFAGSSFPVANLVEGMTCYRTDLDELYRYVGGEWVLAVRKVDEMTGATSSTAGVEGLVPAPQAGDDKNVLHGDGTWKKAIGFESYWEANEAVEVGEVRFPYGREYSGIVLECVEAGTTGAEQPEVPEVIGMGVTPADVQTILTAVEGVQSELGSRNIKTYTSLAQLGLDNNASEEDVAVALPVNSKIILDGGVSEYPNFQTQWGGYWSAEKNISNAVVFHYSPSYSNGLLKQQIAHFQSWSNPQFTGYKTIAVNGALSMPSENYIDVSCPIGVWFNEYFAPADGWFGVAAMASTVEVRVRNSDGSYVAIVAGRELSVADKTFKGCLAPVRRGQNVLYVVEGASAIEHCRFVYAQSEV